ncbi:MAG: hypothetical protein V4787_19445 [Pseudomonadota bacterium]
MSLDLFHKQATGGDQVQIQPGVGLAGGKDRDFALAHFRQHREFAEQPASRAVHALQRLAAQIARDHAHTAFGLTEIVRAARKHRQAASPAVEHGRPMIEAIPVASMRAGGIGQFARSQPQLLPRQHAKYSFELHPRQTRGRPAARQHEKLTLFAQAANDHVHDFAQAAGCGIIRIVEHQQAVPGEFVQRRAQHLSLRLTRTARVILRSVRCVQAVDQLGEACIAASDRNPSRVATRNAKLTRLDRLASPCRTFEP